jgi:hypothetical protein
VRHDYVVADETPVEGTPRDRRFAALAAVLARAASAGEIVDVDALRVIRHELRRRNVNRAIKSGRRSVAAQAVIDKYAMAKTPIPKNSSDDALHCDHVFPLSLSDLQRLQSVDAWMAELPRFTEVVCLTAVENYRLEVLEKTGASGWSKYEAAGIRFCDPVSELA